MQSPAKALGLLDLWMSSHFNCLLNKGRWGKIDQWFPEAGRREKWGVTVNEYEAFSDENVLKLALGSGKTLETY